MAYVDLNPIRAKMANKPEESDHTSVQNRLTCAAEGKQPKQLLRFAGMPRQVMPKGLPFELKSYLELVELTGRIMREDKLGHINNMTIPLLERLNISPENWLKLTTQFYIKNSPASIEKIAKESLGMEKKRPKIVYDK